MQQMLSDAQDENQAVKVKIVGFGSLAEAAVEQILRDTIPNAETNSETSHTDHAGLVIVAVETSDENGVNAACDFIRTAKAENALVFSVVFQGSEAAGCIKCGADAVFVASSEEAFAEALNALYRHMALFLENECVVSVNFSDLKAMFTDAGEAYLTVGFGKGPRGASLAARDAMTHATAGSFSPSLSSVFVGIAGNESIEILDFQRAIDVICEAVDEDAGIVWCFAADPETADAVRVIVVVA